MEKIFNITCFLIILTVFFNPSSIAQTLNPKKSVLYLANGVTSPVGQNSPSDATTFSTTTCDGNDVRILPSPLPQSEVHISINKQNANVLLLSANTFPTSNSWQGAYWSTNANISWTGSDNLPNNAPGRGDPSTAFDATGNGYIATMSYPAGNINAGPDGYAIQRTTNNGTTWGTQVSGSGTINGLDKIMVAADDVQTSPFANNFYCTWTNFDVSNGRIEFNRSTNGGTTFSTPIALNANWGQGANVQTGPNGEVYVCWADYSNNNFPEKGLGFTKSTNGGQNFTSAAIAFPYVGIRTSASADPNFNNTRINSFPSMAVDKSNGAHRGRIYVTYAAKENGNGKSVIEMRFSDNQGTTWSNPSVLSISNGRQNWFPWMAVDDANGNIYITYYSLDEATGFNTNTYVAVSNDAGQSFVNQRVSDVNHVTAPIPEFSGGYIGDYIGITAFEGCRICFVER